MKIPLSPEAMCNIDTTFAAPQGLTRIQVVIEVGGCLNAERGGCAYESQTGWQHPNKGFVPRWSQLHENSLTRSYGIGDNNLRVTT